ncbi:DUF3971 domain-containing protein [Undibacter mobilis]|uniref:DUF3971 domain-containing protein n=1 Tax=Undibacter mobilis TaxID=2292256 RepID=UPI00143DB027|nr:DUF3971 domain-containing protein [Undibacter mobilis]
MLRHRTFRRLFWSLTLATAVIMVAAAGLWWRLNSGPIELDIATPWLKQAIEENFGAGDKVSVGGTQIERDERGRTSLRLRDIEVRNAEGVVVASAPKAEVGLSGLGLLYGRVRAQSLNLVGAAMSIRIETDGRVTVFAGGEGRPIMSAPPTLEPAVAPKSDAPPQDASAIESPRAAFADLAGIMTWIDNVGASGLDGHELREVGLKNGSLMVDDRRTGKRLTFDRINASLTRPEQGGVVFRLESVNPERPWIISAAMRPLGDGVRALGLEARKVSTSDLMLAARLDTSGVEVNLPISASVRAEVGADGKPGVVQGEFFSDPGTIIDHGKETVRYDIDRIDARFNWDARRGNLIVPFQINAGSNQFTLRATLEPPAPNDAVWRLDVTRGDPVIDPVILGASSPKANDGLALNRVNIRGRFDPAKKRFDLDQGDISRVDSRPMFNVAVAVTGSLDFSGEPHIAFGVAGTRMQLPTMMKLWPIFAAREVREWVDGHISSGIVERVVVAGNAPMSNFKDGGPPTPEDGLSVDIETSGTTLRPVDDLPEIRDADLTVRVTGASATVNLGRGTVEVAGGRKLNVASGVFSIPNTHLKPSPSTTTFRADGTVPAAAALLASDTLRDKMGLTIDPATSRGTMSAQVTIKLPLAKQIPPDATSYSVDADLQNFAADKLLLGQKIEAQALKVNASNTGYSIKGDVKVNGTAAKIDLRRGKGDDSAQLSMTASIDEAARRRLGFDFGASVTGTIPIKATGAVGDNIKDERLNIDADLTPVKIDSLLPGWVKPAGKPARATYAMIKSANRTRFEDLSIEGAGASVKGTVEIDNNGNLLLANFPTFALSDGDKLSVKVDRGDNGALKVLMRGDVYDGRNFVKSSLAGADEDPKSKQMDLDLDIRIGAVAGHNGETLRGLDLKLSRRGGQIRTFNLNAKIGRDTPLSGDLRMRARDNHRVVYLETDDAGALFRFTDTYPRIFGGRMWLAMDPPTQEQKPQVGTIVVRDFVIRGEPALDRIVATSGASGPQGIGFAEASAGFTKSPGRMSVRDGVVRGPLVGATVEGQVDFARSELHLRGTFVPLYGLNNIFGLGQIPIVGLFLGGSNEGLLGITYEATGAPGAPRITVNPVSAIAPGLLRKFIPSPGTFDPKFMPAPQ